jgi:two-component system NtrC family sensor kinase
MKVLIVDDNGNDRKLLRLNLERHGCEMVIEAREGQEGFDLARAHRPDLIISDALMQGVDGFEFLHMLKTDEALKNIPFVFHSSVYTGSRDEELASRLGAEAFITKPKEPEEFWTEIAAVLERLAIGAMKPPPSGPMEEEREYLREYSGVVAAKLEEKVQELEDALARARATEEKLQILSSAIEQSPVSIVITDAQGLIEYVNPKFSQMTGFGVEESLGRNPRFLKSGKTSQDDYRRLWATITGGNVWQGEFQNIKKNGELFFESATISPVKNRQGEITHYIAIKEDITEKRKLEEQLRQAQKMEAIGTLAGGVAHDFNNILTAIIGYGNLMEMKMTGDDPLLASLKQILAAADRAADLTRSLLAFSRKQIINPQPVDLNEVVRQMGHFLQRIIGEDIELKSAFDGERLTVNADSGQIGQVMMNLATNARDAMPGGGTLSIETAKAEIGEAFINNYGFGTPGEYALISITDTGSGMDEETRKRLFEPFFTTKEVGKGTGLGLAIVYGIVKQHNGYITVSSEPGQGTTIAVYLPLLRMEAVPQVEAPPGSPAAGTETLLLADDDATLRSLAEEVFRNFGYTVLVAEDGQDALEKFRANREKIALVILDVIMPKMNGKEVFDEIRKLSPACKVIFMSGYTADIIHNRGFLDEGSRLVTKPLRLEKLVLKVRELLDGKEDS